MTATHVDPRDVKLTFNGIELTGYADGTFIEVAGDMPPTPRTRSLPRRGTVTCTLTQVGGDFDALMADIVEQAAAQGVQMQTWNLAKLVKRAIRRWRRKQRMVARRRRGRGATSA